MVLKQHQANFVIIIVKLGDAMSCDKLIISKYAEQKSDN